MKSTAPLIPDPATGASDPKRSESAVHLIPNGAQPRAKPDEDLDTLPKLLMRQVQLRGDRIAVRKKEYGIWHTWTWNDVESEVRCFACGLATRGFRRGDYLAIVGDIRARLYWASIAAQALGGVAVPFYSDSSIDDIVRMLVRVGPDVRYVVVQDQEQVDKLLAVRSRYPALAEIIYCDPRGMMHYVEPCLTIYETVRKAGQVFSTENPGFFKEQVRRGSQSDVGFIVQSAGTAAEPKAVTLTNASIIKAARNSIAQIGLTERDQILAFLPMAMGTSILFYLVQPLVAGFRVNFPERAATILSDLREVGPTFFFAPPSFYKGMFNLVMSRVAMGSSIKRSMFYRLCGNPSPHIPSLVKRLVVSDPLKNVLGLSRVRVALTTGDTIGPAVQDFYRELGINVRHFYGPSEGCCFVSVQPDTPSKRSDDFGVPADETRITVSDQGEVMFKGPHSFSGYHGTDGYGAAVDDPEGWIRTGHAGYVDAEGRLSVVGSLTDRQRLSDGSEFFPQPIERRLKFSPYIREALAVGHGRNFVSALVDLEFGTLSTWAKQQNLKYSGYFELSQHDEVYALIDRTIKEVNAYLQAAGQGHLQIRRFVILGRPFNAELGEVTQTGRLRRARIAENYSSAFDAIDSDAIYVALSGKSGPENVRVRTTTP